MLERFIRNFLEILMTFLSNDVFEERLDIPIFRTQTQLLALPLTLIFGEVCTIQPNFTLATFSHVGISTCFC